MNDEHLKVITKGDTELMIQILDVFISQNSTDLLSLDSAVSESDSKQAYYYVHKIKSSFRTLGFIECYSALNDLEIQFQEGTDVDKLSSKISSTVIECQSVLEEAKIYKAENL